MKKRYIKHSNNTTYRSYLSIAIFTFLFSLLSHGTFAANQSELVIAVVGPLSGQGAKFGEQQQRAVELAAQHFNSKGIKSLPRLKIVNFDDGCDPNQAKKAAESVVEAGIQYVVGHLCSGATLAGLELYAKHGVVVITPGSTNPAITENGYEKVFRSIGRDDQQGKVAARYISDVVKARRLAIVDDGRAYGQGLAKEVASHISESTTIVLQDSVKPEKQDYSSLVSSLKKNAVDFVYFGGMHEEMGRLMREARSQQLNVQFMGGDSAASNDINEISGGAADGMLVTLPSDFSSDKKNATLKQQLQEQDIDPTSPYTFTSYTALYLLAEGIKVASSTNVDDVASALRSQQYATPIGTVAYDNKGDVKDFRFSIFRWNSTGENKLMQY